MREISVEDLTAAIRTGCRLHGPKFVDVKGRRAFANRRHPAWLLPFQPPFQQASFEYKANANADDVISPEQFEKRADKARREASGIVDPASPPVVWPRVRRSVLFEALAKAAAEESVLCQTALSPTERLRLRTGLQLYGVEIVADDDKDRAPLDLVNGDFPFSLRLICCVIRVPLALSNLRLVTLDLSGSALCGVDGAFLRASGSVRIRNVYSSGPVDFAGATIHGYFDGCDALLQPFGVLPAGQAVDSDRGMLNLSQAQIDNEVRLKRAVVWGGLAMRGLKAKRSVVLDEAILLSPLAVLEQMLFVAIKKNSIQTIRLNKQISPKPPKPVNYTKDYRILNQLFCDQNLEVFFSRDGGGTFRTKLENSCLNVLMTENLRVRTSAFRADGMNAESVIARSVMCSGRLRMKYATVHDGLSLQGASLSSPEFQRANFDYCWYLSSNAYIKDIYNYRIDTYRKIVLEHEVDQQQVAYGADDYALDIRESRFGGSVTIGTKPNEFQADGDPRTEIDGVIALGRANIGGELIFNAAVFSWTFRYTRRDDIRTGADYDKALKHNNDKRHEECAEGKRFAVRARGIVVGDNVSFARSKGLRGADFSNAEIGGDLAFFASMGRPASGAASPAVADSSLAVTEAAETVRARITLEGAKLGGDCRLLFDRVEGPHLKAERVEVAGALVISAPPANDMISMSAKAYAEQIGAARDVIETFKAKAAEGPGAFRAHEEGRRRIPMIDLGNARAGFLHHPPPAWPQAGRLVVTGFRYQRALAYGPLGPHPFIGDSVVLDKAAQRRTRVVTVFILIVGVVLAFFGMMKGCFVAEFGMLETISTALLLVSASLYRWVSKEWSPRLAGIHPMAVSWLNLQTVARNAYRRNERVTTAVEWPIFDYIGVNRAIFRSKGHVYYSLEPFSVAAQALREEGRWISANLVEEIRLKKREDQLSWRINLVTKALYKSTSVVNNYGFSLTRPVFFVLLFVFFSAMLAHSAQRNCAIEPKAYRIDGAVLNKGSGLSPARCETRQGVCKPDGGQCDGSADNGGRSFTPILYAIDTVIPALDLGQDREWELKKDKSPMAAPFAWLTYEYLFASLHIAGLTIFALLLVALTARLGLFVNRYGE